MFGRLAVAFGAVASTKAGSCPDDVSTLTVADVQALLAEWDLDFAFGPEFERQRVNGFQLQHISKTTVNFDAYPNAQPFHWAAFWSRLKGCEINAPKPTSRPDSLTRRRLDTQQGSGLKILRDDAIVTMGVDGDVSIRRSGDEEVTMDNNLNFCGHGLSFCNAEGDAPTITSDDQGNVYIGGNIHFTGNVSFAGLHIDQYVEKVFDDITPEVTCDDGSCVSCADVLAKHPDSEDGVYLITPDGENSMYAYCDMSDDGWTLLMRYSESGYHATFNFGEASVPTSSGGEDPPTDQVWAPMPTGNDDGKLNVLAFDLSGGRPMKATCTHSGESYTYYSNLATDWTPGVQGDDNGSSNDDVAWVIMSGEDIGLDGRSHHYICGANYYEGSRGVGLCNGAGSSGDWGAHRASVSFWPTSQSVGCNGADGTDFELWVQ